MTFYNVHLQEQEMLFYIRTAWEDSLIQGQCI